MRGRAEKGETRTQYTYSIREFSFFRCEDAQSDSGRDRMTLSRVLQGGMARQMIVKDGKLFPYLKADLYLPL